ncbi:MAG: hypothetical protein KKF48_00185 [Nanoarchaeota archaeon]|nr:hypothetical protein [Nanoarchaeota archaeon]MBU1027442.1 hypothetical protein [Nanoarchaeota archaeon]
MNTYLIEAYRKEGSKNPYRTEANRTINHTDSDVSFLVFKGDSRVPVQNGVERTLIESYSEYLLDVLKENPLKKIATKIVKV